MPRRARTAAARRCSAAAGLVRWQRTSRLTPRGAPGAGVSTGRRVCAAATRRGPGRAATSPAAPASSASSATHRRDGPAVMLVHAVRARAQPAAEREGARAEPVPRRRASTRALLVANALTRCSGVAPRQRSNERRGAWPSTAIRGEASPPSSLATNARRVHARKPPRPREEAALELARVDRHRHAPGRVVRGGAARQLEEALEPAPRRAAMQGDALEALGMGRHRTPRSPERRAAGARSPGPHAAPPHRPGPPAARAARRPPGPVRPQIARPSPSLTPPPRAPTALVRRARGGGPAGRTVDGRTWISPGRARSPRPPRRRRRGGEGSGTGRAPTTGAAGPWARTRTRPRRASGAPSLRPRGRRKRPGRPFDPAAAEPPPWSEGVRGPADVEAPHLLAARRGGMGEGAPGRTAGGLWRCGVPGPAPVAGLFAQPGSPSARSDRQPRRRAGSLRRPRRSGRAGHAARRPAAGPEVASAARVPRFGRAGARSGGAAARRRRPRRRGARWRPVDRGQDLAAERPLRAGQPPQATSEAAGRGAVVEPEQVRPGLGREDDRPFLHTAPSRLAWRAQLVEHPPPLAGPARDPLAWRRRPAPPPRAATARRRPRAPARP